MLFAIEKPVPVIVTVVLPPIGPAVGETPLTVGGGGLTVSAKVLDDVPVP